MKYAVIKTGGKQYTVAEGDVIQVEHLTSDEQKISFSDVLLYAEDADIKVGSPIVANVSVLGTILGDVKGDKIRVSKFKAKARYRRVTGHRQSLSQIKIESIGSAKSSEKKEAKVVAPETEVVKTVKKSAPKKAAPKA